MTVVSFDEVRSLAKRALENDQKALAGILYTVLGSMAMGSEIELLFHVESFARSQLEQISEIEKYAKDIAQSN